MSDSLQAEQVQAILRAAEALIDEAVGFLQGMIRFPTVNPPGYAYPECAHYIGEHLHQLGYDIEYLDLTQEEIAELAPYGNGQPRTNVVARLVSPVCLQHAPVMHFNGHMDVVPVSAGWSSDPFAGE